MKKTLILFMSILSMLALSACGETTIDCETGFILDGSECVIEEKDEPVIVEEPVVEEEPQQEDPEDVRNPALLGIDHDGVVREFILYLPEGIEEDAPLVVMLHGFSGTATSFMSYTGMNDIADINKFAVVYPLGSAVSGTTHWNSDLSFTTVDDVGFLVAMVEYLQVEYNLSTENTFVSGHSNGGFMSYTLACSATGTFKAIGSYAGLMSGETWDTCDASEPISILQIHGTSDVVVPNDGTMTTFGGWGGAPAVLTMLEYWTTLNDTGDVVIDDTNDKVTIYSWKNETTKDIVTYYEIPLQSHSWPGDDVIFTDEDTLNDTSQLIWAFFSTVIDNE